MTAHGNTVVVYDRMEFEKLLVLPTSLEGWYDPDTGLGVVKFPTPAHAVDARRMA